jgi:MerR family transcriptional regulator, copper efflux regulator
MRIGELAHVSGVSVRTIRFYEDSGLLLAVDRASSGYRAFNDSHVHQLRFIRNARAFGLTLEQIREILNNASMYGSPCECVRANVQASIETTDQRIASLQTMRTRLQTTLDRLDQVLCDDDTIEICPAIEPVPGDVGSSLDSPLDWRR